MRVLLVVGLLVLAACGGSPAPRPAPTTPVTSGPATTIPATTSTAPVPAVPPFAHIVVVIEENHAAGQVVGSAAAPYLNALARTGAQLADSFGITHPSEPNYLALFSGSTHGLSDDSCPHTYTGDNLAEQLRAAGQSFVGYAEGLPGAGFTGCSAGAYARKHAPWTDFADLPASIGQPMTAFPADYARLPRVAFVVPDLDHDMHDGTVAQADSWLRDHLGAYVTWARTHDSLLVVTWDEDDNTARNQIPGVLAGAHVRIGAYRGRVDHYTMLRTIEAACGLPGIGTAADRTPITAVWTS